MSEEKKRDIFVEAYKDVTRGKETHLEEKVSVPGKIIKKNL